MQIVTEGKKVEDIVEEQFWLAAEGNISLTESAFLSDFEREAYVGLVAKRIKQKSQQLNIST